MSRRKRRPLQFRVELGEGATPEGSLYIVEPGGAQVVEFPGKRLAWADHLAVLRRFGPAKRQALAHHFIHRENPFEMTAEEADVFETSPFELAQAAGSTVFLVTTSPSIDTVRESVRSKKTDEDVEALRSYYANLLRDRSDLPEDFRRSATELETISTYLVSILWQRPTLAAELEDLRRHSLVKAELDVAEKRLKAIQEALRAIQKDLADIHEHLNGEVLAARLQNVELSNRATAVRARWKELSRSVIATSRAIQAEAPSFIKPEASGSRTSNASLSRPTVPNPRIVQPGEVQFDLTGPQPQPDPLVDPSAAPEKIAPTLPTPEGEARKTYHELLNTPTEDWTGADVRAVREELRFSQGMLAKAYTWTRKQKITQAYIAKTELERFGPREDVVDFLKSMAKARTRESGSQLERDANTFDAVAFAATLPWDRLSLIERYALAPDSLEVYVTGIQTPPEAASGRQRDVMRAAALHRNVTFHYGLPHASAIEKAGEQFAREQARKQLPASASLEVFTVERYSRFRSDLNVSGDLVNAVILDRIPAPALRHYVFKQKAGETKYIGLEEQVFLKESPFKYRKLDENEILKIRKRFRQGRSTTPS